MNGILVILFIVALLLVVGVALQFDVWWRKLSSNTAVPFGNTSADTSHRLVADTTTGLKT